MLDFSKTVTPQGPSPKNSTSKADKRSKLHVSSVVHWLRKRHQDTANLNYLMLPNERKQHTEVQDVFRIFDADSSGKLALGEFYDMLRHVDITIGKDDLKEFYKKVDLNNDIALDFQEFKNCTLSDEANFYFAKMMEKIRKEAQQHQQEKKNAAEEINKYEYPFNKTMDTRSRTFQPRTFGNLLNFIQYENKKKNLKDFVQNKDNDLGEKFKKFGELLDLHMDKDIYGERLGARFEQKSPIERSERGSVFRISTYKNSVKGVQIDSQTSVAESEDNVDEEVSNNSSDDCVDEIKDVDKPKLLKELNQISKKAKMEAKEEILARRRKEKRHTHVVVGSAGNPMKRSSFARSRDSFLSKNMQTQNFDEKTSGSMNQLNSQRVMTVEDYGKGSYIGGSKDKINTCNGEDFIKTSNDYGVGYKKNTHATASANQIPSKKRCSIWAPDGSKKEADLKGNSETNNRITLPSFKGSIQIPDKEENYNRIRMRLASPQGFLRNLQEDTSTPKIETSPKFFTPKARTLGSRRLRQVEKSPDSLQPLNFSQHLASLDMANSTEIQRLNSDRGYREGVQGSGAGSRRIPVKQPSKMPNNYMINLATSGNVSSRSTSGTRMSKPGTPTVDRETAKEKPKRVSIFAKQSGPVVRE